ncbi:hypothetical protein BDB01DRAFT_724328 [Pilobolus umbonatus]|nr:hypothetical protein BDB01DRAFT_724328 [Pilobolus umbonatus]
MNPFTVVLAARILGRLLITQGPTYINKFRTQSEGFIVLQTLLPAYWNLLQLHEALLAMMMGIDIAYYPLYPTFDINHLRTCLQNSKQTRMAIPDLLPVITSLWNEGRKVADVPILSAYPPSMRTSRNRSNSAVVYPIKGHKKKEDSLSARIQISKSLDEFIRLFKDLYNARPDFREACNKQDIYDCLLKILFPSICPSAIPLTIEDELCSKDAVLSNFEMEQAPSIVSSPMDTIINDRIGDDTSSIDSASTPGFNSIIKRGGASTRMTKTSPHVSKRGTASMTRLRSASWSQAPNLTDMKMIHSSMLNSLVDFIVDVCINSILDPNNKNLTNLTLVMSAFPPSGHDQQLLFESYLLTHIAQKLKGIIQLEMEILYDHKILINMTKFCQMAADAVIQGRFREGGAEQTYDLSVTLLELLHNDEFTSDYSNYDASIGLLYKSFNRMILVKISDLEHGDLDIVKIVAFLDYCIHHQKIILSVKNTDIEFLKCFCYHLYRYLLSSDEGIKNTAANIWKLLILQKADIITSIFKVRVKGMESEELIGGFTQMLEMDMESFYRWLDSRKVELNILFNEHICKAWENVILQEQKYSRETLRNYVTRRINKLKRLQRKEIYEQDVILDYTSKSLSWSSTIHEQEIGLFTKVLQDNDTHDNSIRGEWSNISDDLLREKAIWGPEQAQNLKWGLDNTEGPNRMRKRLKCLSSMHSVSYLPKHGSAASSNTRTTPSTAELKRRSVNLDKELKNGPKFSFKENENKAIPESNDSKNAENNDLDEDDELSYEEDKNLKVTRLLERGDFVHDVYNVSQISGLDACEGLLILCQNNIYLIDNFFQQADGDIAEIWDVPKEERDQYLLLIAQAAGMDTETFNKGSGELHRCRKWATADLRDVFKRRFLFRDVALEIFFTDGRNALITVSLSERDEVYSKLVSRVSTHDESSDTIFGGDKDNYTSGLSSTFRLSSIFGTSTLHELTQRWERHDISNFQYLMYLNAIAGRSYNDITQYPVFPWILADYKSEELDLDDPFTFRDLTRPMGAQTSERRIEFADRYRQWKETDDPAPAFHYGTHYSSAMIVCSFLIRLEPFTQNYLKLQGGTFDHADRLFDSVGKAWDSASEKNMGDVRELIPEFFYLPEFLTNVNKFNFGIKQGTGEAIDSVVLPPWAHGDPKIFIQKHREALESDHVSRNLHHWIDLIFGYKQQGPAAIDSLNVFHHISYEGAVDLDSITDIVEKTATIGIINNFGQTPRQLFKKPHPSRLATPKDPMVLGAYKFEDYLDLLTQSRVPIRGMQLLMPPDGSRYIEWGFTDSSLRVFSTDTGKVCRYQYIKTD